MRWSDVALPVSVFQKTKECVGVEKASDEFAESKTTDMCYPVIRNKHIGTSFARSPDLLLSLLHAIGF